MKLLEKNVLVTWEDAWSDSDNYYRLDSIAKEKPFICHSIGHVIQHDRSGITLAMEFFNKRYRKVQHIPRQMVRKVKVLR